jgi:cell division protein ZapA
MPDLDLQIGSRSYRLSCEPGQEDELRSAASLLNSEAEKIGSGGARTDETRVLLMAGLMLADRLTEAENSVEDPRIKQLESALVAADHQLQEAEAKTRALEIKLNDAERKIVGLRATEQTDDQPALFPAESDDARAVLGRVAADIEALADEIEARKATLS